MVRAAAADIPGHCRIDLLIAGLAFVAQQSHSLHDLSGLTIAALGHVEVHPRLLHGMQSVLGEPFYRGNLHAGNAAHSSDAGPDGLAILVYGARTTKPYPTAKLGSGQP